MTDSLFIGDTKVDLKENQPISLTYSQADISDPSKRVRSYSKTFELAGTQNNLKFFKEFAMLSWVRNDGQITDVSFNPSANLPCKLYKNEYLRFEGFIKLIDIKINKGVFSFVVNMYSDVSNMFQRWDELLISDLGWDEYNHELNEEHVRFSWNDKIKKNGVWDDNFAGLNPKGYGYLYGLIDYGLSPDQTNYVDNQLFPLVYYREIFLKAFNYLGYNINSSFIDSQEFKDLLFGWAGGENPSLPQTLVDNLEIDALIDASFSATRNADLVQDPIYGSEFYNDINTFKTLNLLDSEITFSQVKTADVQNQLIGGLISVSKTAKYKIDVNFTALINNVAVADPNSSLNNQQLRITLFFVRNGNRQVIGNYNKNGQVTAQNWVFSKSLEMNLSSNDNYYFEFSISSKASGAQSLFTEIDLNNTFQFNSICTESEVTTGSTVYLSNYIPKMKVVDFIKSAITHFNLYISDPSTDNVIKIEPMPDFYDSNNNFDVWDRKQDVSKEIVITPLATKQPSTLNFKFKPDNDFYRETYFNLRGEHYGDYTHNNNLSYGNSSQDYQLNYSITPLVELYNGLVIPRIIKIENGVVKPFKGSPRVYYYGGMKAGSFNIIEDSGAVYSQTSYPVLSNLDSLTSPTVDLCFSTPEIVFYTATSYTNNTAYRRFYSLLVNELNSIDSKMLTSYFRLNQNDVSNGFMERIKVLNGVPYRFNLLKDYNINKDGSYQVELIKILDVKSNVANEFPITPTPSFISISNNNDVVLTAKDSVASAKDGIIIYDSEVDGVITLDSSKLPLNKTVTIMNLNGSHLDIETEGEMLIDGNASITLNSSYSYATILNLGNEYVVINSDKKQV